MNRNTPIVRNRSPDYLDIKMNLFNKRYIALFLVFIVSAAIAVAADSEPTGFTVLFFNDLHGHLQPFTVKTENGTEEVGGVARLAALVKSIRAENNQKGIKTFLLVAGDILQGTPMSTLFHGEPDMECFKRMGVDAAVIGNHEFDFGLENFRRLQRQAGFPFISANLDWAENGRPLADAVVSFELTGDLRVTVIGVTTRDLMTTTNPDNVTAIRVRDPVGAAVTAFRYLPHKGPVILLSHCRHQTDRDIAAALPELTAIIGGHDQILLSPYRRVSNVPVFQAFEKGRYLGRLDFQLDPDTGGMVLKGNAYLPINAQITPDPEVQAIVDQYARRMDSRFTDVIGRTTVFLDGERERIRWEETTLGNFVTDIMRRHTGTRIALLNAGSLRSSINTGDITLADVFRAMPYANELVTITLTGKEVLQTLERSVQGKREEEDGGFLHVSGLRFTIVHGKPEHVSVGPDNTPLLPDTTYPVTIIDFLYSGGDGYRLFMGKPALRTGLPLRELIVDDIRAQKVISPVLEGRIIRIENF